MASLGSLIVSLGLNAVEFTTGLSKAEFEAQKFAKKLDEGIASAAKAGAAGIALITTAAIAAAAAVDSLAKEAARFKDLEEITGASAESLASFAVAAKVAGTDMNSIATASVKLTKNLVGVDDESKAAGAALKALGINIQSFKQLDPAAQIDAIATALAGFADGSAKTAVAVALLGKSGAELLPFLKELGSGIGRQNVLTQQQIELADEYADRQARAAASLQLYLQVAATQALPVFTAVTNAAKEFIKELVGIEEGANDLAGNNAVEIFATKAARALAFVVDSGDALVRIFRIVNAVLSVGVFKAGPQIQAILAQEQFSAKLERQLAEIENNRKFPGEGGGRRRERPALQFSGADKQTAALKERTSEAERFLESLQKQLEKTQELTVVEQVLLDIQKGRIQGLTPALQEQILAVAGQIDAAHRLAEEIKAINKAFEEEKRIVDAANKDRERATKAAFDQAQSVADSNNALRDEIAIILGGDFARKALEKDHLNAAIAIKEERLAQLQLDDSRRGEAAALEAEIVLLKERQELLKGKDIAEQLAAEARSLQEFKNLFADTAASAFADFINGSKSAKDAFRDFANSVSQQLVRLAAQSLANKIFGGTTGGGFDLGSVISKLFGLFGTGGGGFGSFSLNGAAAGTSFARGGATLVGERGPEIVNLPRGAQVIPNDELMARREARSINLTQHINVMPGATTQSARQAAALVRDAVSRSIRDR